MRPLHDESLLIAARAERRWSGYVLIGAGYGMAVPTISSVVVSALPLEHSGLASGVLNSARQVGTAVELAALGVCRAGSHRNSWAAHSAQLPTSARARAPDIVQHVSGGQGRVVAQQLGPCALPLADSAFADGLHVALLIGGGLMLIRSAATARLWSSTDSRLVL